MINRQQVWTTITEFMMKQGLDSRSLVLPFIIVLIVDISFLAGLSRMKRKYNDNGDDSSYLIYYKKKQYIQTIRGVMRVLLVIGFIVYRNPGMFAGLAIAVGAFVIVLSTIFQSLMMYIYLLSNYKPGNSVKIDDMTGEIMAITPLYLKILGRNESGDHTGELITIPNYQVWQKTITLIELSSQTVQKVVISLPYTYEIFHISFEEFVARLRVFLDDEFKKNTSHFAQHYRSYIGHKYKLNYNYKDDKSVVDIAFLAQRNKAIHHKYRILALVEQLKHTPQETPITPDS